MTAGREPERWLTSDEDAAELLRPALKRARTEGPSARELERMWGALAATLPPTASGGAAADRGTTRAAIARQLGKAGWWRTAGVALSAAAVGFTIARVTQSPRRDPKPRPLPAAEVTPARTPDTSAGPAETDRLTSPDNPGHSSSANEGHPSPGGDRIHARVESVPDRHPQLQPAPENETPQPSKSERLRAAGKTAAQSGRAAKPPETGGATTPAPADLAGELDLLSRARRVIETAPQRALQLTAEHAQRYREGALTQEREALAIDALLRLGQNDRAAARTRRFAERYPDSAHRPRLESERRH